MCDCVRVYALRIVSRDKSLRFKKKYFVIFLLLLIFYTCTRLTWSQILLLNLTHLIAHFTQISDPPDFIFTHAADSFDHTFTSVPDPTGHTFYTYTTLT